MRTETPRGSDPSEIRLALFPAGTDAARRRRRQIFLAVYVAIALSLVWPIYPFFSRAFPLVLGLPFSLAWVVAALAAMFAALLWLFRSEEEDRPPQRPAAEPQRSAADPLPSPRAPRYDPGPDPAGGPPPVTGREEGVPEEGGQGG